MKTVKTHLYCLDDHRIFTEDLRKKFDDQNRYSVMSFQASGELLNKLENDSENHSCKIAILGLHDPVNEHLQTEKLISDIKKTGRNTGVILIHPAEKTGDMIKNPKLNVDAYIPYNTNAVLRIHNAVKKLFSEHNINIRRKRRNLSLIILSLFILIAALFIYAAWRNFPEYF